MGSSTGVPDSKAGFASGTIREEDLANCLKTDSVDEAFDYLIRELSNHAIESPGGDL